MIVAGSASPLLLSSAGGYNLTKSLRLRSSASARLTRTYTATGSTQKFTGSVWVKRGTLGASQTLFGAQNTAATTWDYFNFNASDQLQLFIDPGTTPYNVITSSVFRDPSAWYHVVFAVDTTQATASNRVRIYVNGVEQPLGTNTIPQNYNLRFNVNGNTAGIGTQVNYVLPTGPVTLLDGYLAELNWIDGTQLTPSSFGQTSSITGVWQPIKYTGTYGTNGFYLPFTDVATTSGSNAGLGKDFSGNGNYWTTNNISVTAGTTYDSMSDVPTLTNATTANYAVMNPLNKASLVTVTDGNLTLSPSSASWGAISGTVAVTSGKWYYEYSASISSALTMCGWATTDEDVNTTYGSAVTKQWVMYFNNGNKYGNGSNAVSYASSVSANTVVGVALDMDAGTLTFYIGGVSQGTAFSTGLTGKTLVPWIPLNSGAGAFSGYVNFGQRPFTYTPPTGFVALNTFNLPTPTIGATASTTANKYFDVTTYTGTGASTQTVTNSGSMQPDFVWVKDRSQSTRHVLTDSVRGAGLSLYSNTTDSEGTNDSTGYMSAFNSNGFTLNRGSGGLGERVNYNGDAYVGWQWRASNASGVTNTAGSITSTVSANTTAGFSIVTYTGTGANATVGHGLGVAPKMVIVKKRSGTSSWPVYHANLTSASYYLLLESTSAETSNNIYWQGTAPTSTVFSIGTTSNTNENGSTYVAYCFAQVAGYSAFGSYVGNSFSAGADGTFVYLGFRPRFVLVKLSSSSGYDWVLYDSARSPTNVTQNYLNPNTANSENAGGTVADIDFLSNGFKLRNNSTSAQGTNIGNQTYIYAAFAESPFKYANAR